MPDSARPEPGTARQRKTGYGAHPLRSAERRGNDVMAI
jgi:hypothetical protein